MRRSNRSVRSGREPRVGKCSLVRSLRRRCSPLDAITSIRFTTDAVRVVPSHERPAFRGMEVCQRPRGLTRLGKPRLDHLVADLWDGHLVDTIQEEGALAFRWRPLPPHGRRACLQARPTNWPSHLFEGHRNIVPDPSRKSPTNCAAIMARSVLIPREGCDSAFPVSCFSSRLISLMYDRRHVLIGQFFLSACTKCQWVDPGSSAASNRLARTT